VWVTLLSHHNKNIVIDKSSSTIVDLFIMDNQFNSPVIIETNEAEALPTFLLLIFFCTFDAIINACCDPASTRAANNE